MVSAARDPKFYVVGGPVQPDRPCYVSRNADADLFRRLSEGDFCHVLAQRQTGKSSLVAATAWKLRSAGTLVAVADLTQTSEEDPSENAGRWYYSIAYRIARDLRIRADLQTWWAERGGLTNLQRLREFFLEVVLEYTDKPVVVFFDRIEATVGEALAQDLFSAVRACYDARATAAEFQRLTFCFVGAGSPAELVKNVQGSPFEVSAAIELPDFSPQELAGLLPGLGEAPADTEMLLGRVWSWTRGHPYLSQKVFRGLARRKDSELSLETVDELVQTQFLAEKTISEDPHLSAIATRLTNAGSRRTARLNLYGRIRKGVAVMLDTSSEVQKELLTAGLVTIGPDDELRVRNEIYAMAFSTRWVNQNLPFGIKGLLVAAAAVAVVFVTPVWYMEFLPRSYVEVMTTPNQNYEVAAEAYNTLSMLPSHGDAALRHYTAFLAGKAGRATDLKELEQARVRMSALPDGAGRAEELVAGFWERRAREAADRGQRDRALLALLEANLSSTDSRRRWVEELIGQDYRSLRATWHMSSDLRALRIREDVGLVTLLDAGNQLQLWNVAGETPRLEQQLALIAEERLELAVRKTVERAGAGPRLHILTSHPQPGQVEVALRAPSGEEARLPLSRANKAGSQQFDFSFAAYPELRQLATGELAGNWTLALTDSEQGVGGELLDWGLSFDGRGFAADPDFVAQPIPEPRATATAEARLSRGGERALSWPAGADTPGPILVWDVAADTVITRIPRSPDTIDAAFVLDGTRIITLDQRRLAVWDAATGKEVGEVPLTATRLPPLSANRRYAVINTIKADQSPGILVWDLQRMRRVGQLIPAENAGVVAVDSTGRNLAVGGRDAFLRVWQLATGNLVQEFEAGSPLRMLRFDPSGGWLASDDQSSTFRLWNIAEGGTAVIERFGTGPWSVDFATDSSAVLFGAADRVYQVARLPDGLLTGVRLRQGRDGQAPVEPALLATRNLALTTDAGGAVKLWSLPAAAASVALVERRFPAGMRASLSDDGQRIAVGTGLGGVSIHAAGAPGGILLGENESLPDTAGAEVISLAFSPDRRLLAAAFIDGRVRIWNAANGEARDIAIVHPDGGASELMFVDLGQKLISASRREVIVTELASGEAVGRLRIQADDPRVAVARDSSKIYIADDQNGVTLWDWRSGVSESIVPGDYAIRTVAVTPDGGRMVTASDERELLLWNLETLEPLEQSVQLAGRVDDLWIAGGNRLLVQAGYWLQLVGISPNGLSVRSTRLLADAPASVRPGTRPDSAFVLSSSPSRPLLSEIQIAEPPATEVEGDAADLRRYWQSRLGMQIDADGAFQPLSGEALRMSAVDPAAN